MNQDMLDKVRSHSGFIAALDQSGGSTPNALLAYGVTEDQYHGDDEMFDRHCADPRRMPLARVPADVLDLDYEERRPTFHPLPARRPRRGHYVCVAVDSTAGCKLWHYPGGWQQVVDHLRSTGREVVLIQKEPAALARVIDATGDGTNPFDAPVGWRRIAPATCTSSGVIVTMSSRSRGAARLPRSSTVPATG